VPAFLLSFSILVCRPCVQSSLNGLLQSWKERCRNKFYSTGRLDTVHTRFPHESLVISITSHSSVRFLERVTCPCLRRRSSRSRNDQSRVETRVTRGKMVFISSWPSCSIPLSGLGERLYILQCVMFCSGLSLIDVHELCNLSFLPDLRKVCCDTLVWPMPALLIIHFGDTSPDCFHLSLFLTSLCAGFTLITEFYERFSNFDTA
jgi:hypothetical protein